MHLRGRCIGLSTSSLVPKISPPMVAPSCCVRPRSISVTSSLRGAGLTRHTRTGGLAAGYKSGGQLRASSQRSFTTDIKSAEVAPTALPKSQISPVPFSPRRTEGLGLLKAPIGLALSGNKPCQLRSTFGTEWPRYALRYRGTSLVSYDRCFPITSQWRA